MQAGHLSHYGYHARQGCIMRCCSYSLYLASTGNGAAHDILTRRHQKCSHVHTMQQVFCSQDVLISTPSFILSTPDLLKVQLMLGTSSCILPLVEYTPTLPHAQLYLKCTSNGYDKAVSQHPCTGRSSWAQTGIIKPTKDAFGAACKRVAWRCMQLALHIASYWCTWHVEHAWSCCM